jgi:cytochrome c-type biogenesis protein
MMISGRFQLFSHAILFVLGFSLVFVFGWGGAATLFGQFFSAYKTEISQVGGVVVIAFGLVTLGFLKIPWLYLDTRPEFNHKSKRGWLASGLMGVFFAAGWTPCIGTTLGAILTLGFSQETSGQAMVLSSGYALGMGIPFLLIGLGMDRASRLMNRVKRHMRTIQTGSGLFLIGIGLLLLTNQMFRIAIWAQQNSLFLNPALGNTPVPNYLIAILAGVLSFLSPCVLPLVPAYMGYLSSHALRAAPSSVVPKPAP